ncbi:MAG TPA: XrtA system polysaccharide chain length determinant [Candidatus Margulisiibacteriota bacterium]|nr:XrtA system polysaccharide chain length determinant [Candidatus Margulisiibacteriota bacterium]
MMQQLDSLLEQLRGLWRFRWTGMATAWAVLVLGLIVITVLPDRYEASATVFVDTQTALSAATRNLAVDENTDAQIQLVREALLGGPQLGKIADDTGLTARARTPEERQKVVDKLRKEIQITGGAAAAPGAGTYVISYKNKDRESSLKVVDRFVNTWVQQAVGGKREGSMEAQQFLTQQIAELEKRLRDAEEALASFKKEHVGLLPGEQADYFKRLDTELADLDASQTKLSVATMRRNELQRQLRGEEPLVPGAAKENAAATGAPPSDTATRLQQSQRQLDELLLNYTEKHPKVIELRNTIAQLQKRLADEIEAARHGDTSAAAQTGLAASPVYQNLQLQNDQVAVEIAGLQADIANHRQRVASLRSMMNTAPEVEAQFSRLNRDYNVVKAQYEALVEQLGRVHLGEQAAQTGVFRFEVVDPPRAGVEPSFPKRPLFAIGALAAAIAAGGGVAFLLNLLRPAFSSVRHLRERTGLPVLGAVSMTWIERYDALLRRSALQLAGALLGMVLLCGIYVVTQRHLANVVRAWLTYA